MRFALNPRLISNRGSETGDETWMLKLLISFFVLRIYLLTFLWLKKVTDGFAQGPVRHQIDAD